jgi:hypothetical protein
MNNDDFKRLCAEARHANLLDYFRSSSYTVKKFGSEYRVQELGLMINPDKGLWNCFYHNDGSGSSVGGSSAIDCLVKVLGRDFKQAVYELTGKDVTTSRSSTYSGEYRPRNVSQPKPLRPVPAKRELVMPERNPNENQLLAYMCQTRHIPSEIVLELVRKGLLYQSQTMITAKTPDGEERRFRGANAVFVHKDASGNVVGGELQGLNSFKRFKGIAAGTGDSAFMFTPVPSKDGRTYRAFIFESAIDLMSFYTFCNEKDKLVGAMLVSMAGLKPTVPKMLQAQGVRIISCVDNDDAGRRFEQENGFERAPGVIEKLDKIGFKDWNELLVFKSSNPDAYLEQHHPERETVERMNQNEVPPPAFTRR